MQRIRPYVRVVGNTCAFRMRWVWPSVLHIFHNTYNSVSKIMKSYRGVQLSRKYMQSQISAVKLPTDGLNELQTWKRSLSWIRIALFLTRCFVAAYLKHSSDTHLTQPKMKATNIWQSSNLWSPLAIFALIFRSCIISTWLFSANFSQKTPSAYKIGLSESSQLVLFILVTLFLVMLIYWYILPS